MTFTIDQNEHGERIEKILREHYPGSSKSIWKYLISSGNILRDNTILKWGDRVKKGDVIVLTEEPVKSNEWKPAISKKPQFKLIQDNELWMVIDKPPDLPTLPRNPDDKPTLAGNIFFNFPKIVENANPKREAGIVNRLDNKTSGLILVAKTPKVWEKLRKTYMNHHVEKEYWAIVPGNFTKRSWIQGRVISESGPQDRVGWENGDGEKGKLAISLIEPLASKHGYSLVKITTRYGRRHQVRVQLSSLGFPIIGDNIYGNGDEYPILGHFLWARSITFDENIKSRQRGAEKQLVTITSSFLHPTWLSLIEKIELKNHFNEISPFPQ